MKTGEKGKVRSADLEDSFESSFIKLKSSKLNFDWKFWGKKKIIKSWSQNESHEESEKLQNEGLSPKQIMTIITESKPMFDD